MQPHSSTRKTTSRPSSRRAQAGLGANEFQLAQSAAYRRAYRWQGLAILAVVACAAGCHDSKPIGIQTPGSDVEESSTSDALAAGDVHAEDLLAENDQTSDANPGRDDMVAPTNSATGWGADPSWAELAVCDPMAVAPTLERAPDLLDRVEQAQREGLALTRIETVGEPYHKGFELPLIPGDETCFGDRCGVAIGSIALVGSDPHGYDVSMGGPMPQGDPWIGVAHSLALADGQTVVRLETNTVSSTAIRRVERLYDGAGRLLSETEDFNNSRWSEVALTYTDNGLLESAVIEAEPHGTPFLRMDWEYDGEKLIRATASDGREVSYEYDSNSELRRIARFMDGKLATESTWERDGDLLVHSGGTHNANIYARHYLDDHDRYVSNYGLAQVQWDRWGIQKDAARNCMRLPIGPSHGYPVADRAYDLGFKVGTRPSIVRFGYSGIAAVYGFPPAYISGDDSWFGPAGVGTTPVANQPFTWGTEFVGTFSVEYEALQMRREEAVVTLGDGTTFSSTRVREFDATGIHRDSVHNEGAGLPEESLTDSVLTFGYDALGNLESRELHIDDTLRSQHFWTFDGHKPTSHTIGHNFDGWMMDDAQNFEGLSSDMTYQMRYLLEHAEDGFLHWAIEGLEETWGALSWKFDAQNRPIAIRRADSEERFAYENAGYISLHTQDYEGDGNIDRRLEVRATGRLVHERQYEGSGVSWTESFIY